MLLGILEGYYPLVDLEILYDVNTYWLRGTGRWPVLVAGTDVDSSARLAG